MASSAEHDAVPFRYTRAVVFDALSDGVVWCVGLSL